MDAVRTAPGLGRLDSFHLRLAAIAAAGLAVRAVYVVTIGEDDNGALARNDVNFFHHSANLLADGRGYVNPRDYEASGELVPTAEHPPGWPFLLALFSKLGGDGWLAHRLVGCLVGAAVIVALGLLARTAWNERAGLAAALIAAGHPLLVAADGSLMSESLYGLALAVTLIAAFAVLDRPTLGRSAALGAAVALAALVRAEALLLLVLLALPILWRTGPGRLPRTAAVFAAAALVLVPWTARNWWTFDRPVLISNNSGTVLAGANCDATYRGPGIGFWYYGCFSPVVHRNEALQSARWRRQGIDYAADHAGRLAVVIPVRLLRTWGFWDPIDQTHYAEGRNIHVERAGQLVYFLLLPLAAWGAATLRRRRHALLVLLAPVALVVITSITAAGYTRFRHAADLAIVVFAGIAIARIVERRSAPAAPLRT